MDDIRFISVVADSDGQTFLEKLMSNVRRYEAAGCEVEIQYAPVKNGPSALVIGRERA